MLLLFIVIIIMMMMMIIIIIITNVVVIICDSNRTEWSTIQGVNRVSNFKIGQVRSVRPI